MLGSVVAQRQGVGRVIKRSRVRAPATAQLRNDYGQVVHTQLPRRRHSSLVSRVVKLGTFTFREDDRCTDHSVFC